MEWTLITILSRNFKFDRHLFEQGNLRVCLPKANTSVLLRGTFFERWGGEGSGGVIQESNCPFLKWKHYQGTLLVWKDFISNINLAQANSLNLTNLASATTFQIAYRHRSHIKLWAYWSWQRLDFYASSTTNTTASNDLIINFGQKRL